MGLLGGIGDAVSGIFGGGQKAPQLKNASTLNPHQTGLMKILAQDILAPGLRGGVSPYSGTRVPDQNQLLSNYFTGAGGIDTQGLYSGASNALQQSMSGQPLYGADMDAAQKYWESAYYKPAMDKYMNEALPQLRESYAGGTFDSGGRLRAEQKGLSDVMTGLNSNLASIMYGEHQAGQNEMDLAANRAIGSAAQAQQFGQIPGQAGAQQYGFEQAPLEEDYQNWLMQQDYNNPYISSALGLMGMQSQSPYLQQQQPGMASSIGNAFGSMLGMAGGQYAGSGAMGKDIGGLFGKIGGLFG